jgi:tRNA (cytidine/uridine-2'-O-)-methyltransferase
MINLALYHPQIPQNTGTLLRLSSCLGVRLHLIRPFGFLFDNKKLKRSGMDYIATADYEIHDSFDVFFEKNKYRRIVALEAGAEHVSHREFKYRCNDILIVGSEHYGFLKEDLKKISDRVKIPMLPNRRSLNMALASTIVISEAMSQLNLFHDS